MITATYEPVQTQSTKRSLPFLVAGTAYTIVGGLLAAATAYVTTEKTAWATAYIVLIGGVVQIALGAALANLAPKASESTRWLVFALFNLGNLGVLTGQLTRTVQVTDLATVVLAASLVVALFATRRGTDSASSVHPGWTWAFRVLLVFLAASMVVGVVLAQFSK